MIDLSFFKNNILANVPQIAQIITPERVSVSTVDTSSLLVELLGPINNDRIYAYKLPDNPVYPCITYEQSGFTRTEVDGYIIAKTDIFLISIQAEVLEDIIAKQLACNEALLQYIPVNAAGGIEIIDQAVTWQSDLQRYEAAIQIEVTHLTLPSQQTPAYFIYPMPLEADKSQSMTCTSQLVHSKFAGLLIAQVPPEGVTGLRAIRESALQQILGKKKPGSADQRAELVKGGPVGLIGAIVLWRDIFNVTTTTHYN